MSDRRYKEYIEKGKWMKQREDLARIDKETEHQLRNIGVVGMMYTLFIFYCIFQFWIVFNSGKKHLVMAINQSSFSNTLSSPEIPISNLNHLAGKWMWSDNQHEFLTLIPYTDGSSNYHIKLHNNMFGYGYVDGKKIFYNNGFTECFKDKQRAFYTGVLSDDRIDWNDGSYWIKVRQ